MDDQIGYILESNNDLFIEMYTNGTSTNGPGLLIVDTSTNKVMFLKVDDLYLLDDNYESEHIKNNVISYLENNELRENYMYIGVIYNENMHIISKQLN